MSDSTETARSTRATTDHEVIRRWAEERDGTPAAVRQTSGAGDPGILRIDFPGYSGEESLEPIDWEEWFEKFEREKLAFLYQEETSEGEKSNFNRLVDRETVSERL